MQGEVLEASSGSDTLLHHGSIPPQDSLDGAEVSLILLARISQEASSSHFRVRAFEVSIMASTSSNVSSDRVFRAIDALINWVRSKAKHQKAQLLEHDEFVYLTVSLVKIPHTTRGNAFKIPLPHAIHQMDGSEEICLIIDDRNRSHKPLTSEMAKTKVQTESLPISKVIRLTKLKSDYGPFEVKRKLCGSYDLFFVDKRAVPLLPRLLGKHFFKNQKRPLPINLTRGQWKGHLEKACRSAFFYMRMGTCSVLKVGKISFGKDRLVENIMAAIEGVMKVVPMKWLNIRSLHLKLHGSVALPIYQALPRVGLKIEEPKEGNADKNMNGAGDETNGNELTVAKNSKKKGAKRGRIHEVLYMDGDIDNILAGLPSKDENEPKSICQSEIPAEIFVDEKIHKKKKKKETDKISPWPDEELQGKCFKVKSRRGLKSKEQRESNEQRLSEHTGHTDGYKDKLTKKHRKLKAEKGIFSECHFYEPIKEKHGICNHYLIKRKRNRDKKSVRIREN